MVFHMQTQHLAGRTTKKGQVMMTSLTALTVGLSVALVGMAHAAQRIPLSAALAQCKTQGNFYKSNVMDGDSRVSANPRDDQRFRACVYSKSGQYPPKVRKSGIKISGTARIGIIVSE